MVKAIAYYLPQYHRIPENDRWWGEGFTDWVNVKKAKPLFPGHNQPRVPLNQFYYDLSRRETIEWQIDFAKSHGLHGFCHYHYWFDGKQLLETPTNLFLADRTLDFPFCLAWANCSWSRRWDGDESAKTVLIKQTHAPDKEKWQKHFDYLIKAWTDPRAITIEGKPIFLVYSPHTIERVRDLLDYWRQRATEHGLKGVHFVAMQQFKFLQKDFLRHFDATVLFQPAVAMFVPGEGDGLFSPIRMTQYVRSLPQWLIKLLKRVKKASPASLQFHEYNALWAKIISYKADATVPTYLGAFVDWDNTARYGNRARIVRGASPERFEFWFRQLVQQVAVKPERERLIFVNAWNEWAEGSYLEPDERYGDQYLEAVRRSLMPTRG